jgi:HlyD family secretion protein
MKKKWLAITIGCAIVLVGGAGYIWKNQKGLYVAAIKVEPRSIRQTITEEGIVQLKAEQVITSPVSGRIKECAVQKGQAVQTGDLLFIVDTEPLSQQKKQAAKNAESYEAQAQSFQPVLEQAAGLIEQAQRHRERVAALSQAGAAATAELEAADSEVTAAQAAYTEAQHKQDSLWSLAEAARLQEEQLKSDIAKGTVRANADGYIQALNIQTGSYVTPQTEAVIIGVDKEFSLEALVQTGQAAAIKVGDEVEIKANKGEQTITAQGSIMEILPYAVEKLSPLGLTERRVPVKISFDADQLPLRPGYEADVIFTLAQEDEAIAVPKTAVFDYEDGNALWVVDEGRARLQVVELGFKSAYEVVVRSGLQAGDVVIVNGDQAALKEGLKINPQF